MNQFRMQFRRRGVFTALIALLLAIAIAFLSIGLSAFCTAREQLRRISEQYTTIALPPWPGDWPQWLRTEAWPGETGAAIERPDCVVEEAYTGFLNAHVEGCMGVSPYELDDFGSERFDYYGRALMVAAVQCTALEIIRIPIEQRYYDEDENQLPSVWYEWPVVSVEFDTEEIVSMFPAYADAIPEGCLQSVKLLDASYPADRQIPFEVGKTYLLFALCGGPVSAAKLPFELQGSRWRIDEEDGISLVVNSGNKTGIPNNTPSDQWENAWTNGIFSFQRIVAEGSVIYECLQEDSLPYCVEYTGRVEDFLHSKEGAVWLDTILPLCQLNYESADVVFTDNVDSIYMFNSGAASLLEGRKIEKTEYASGTAVCLVSAAYAQKNGLQLGDTIRLDLYDPGMIETSGYRDSSEYGWPTIPRPGICRPENRIGVQKDYTIVGIYTAPEFEDNAHSFSANTIYVPKASIPDADSYLDQDTAGPAWSLYTIILENGKTDELETFAEERGLGGVFTYFDQGYSELGGSYEAVLANARRLLAVAMTAFVLASALGLFLALRRMSAGARGMRLLGIKAQVVWWEMVQTLTELVLGAAVLGGVLGAALYGTVTGPIFSDAMDLDPVLLAASAAGLAAVLIAVCAVCALSVSRRKLMQTTGIKRTK